MRTWEFVSSADYCHKTPRSWRFQLWWGDLLRRSLGESYGIHQFHPVSQWFQLRNSIAVTSTKEVTPATDKDAKGEEEAPKKAPN